MTLKNDYQKKVAEILISIKAVKFSFEKPFILTSGLKSPVYVDCRKIISFVEEREKIINYALNYFKKNNLQFDILAGGETAGIPYSAFFSQILKKPMIYVRKKPKGFGKNQQIEGNFRDNQKVILIEDLATDGGSKVNFVNALRHAGARITDIFVIFFYDIYPGALEALKHEGVDLHYLCTWKDVLQVAKAKKYYEPSVLKAVENFLMDPVSWSKKNGGSAGIDLNLNKNL